MLGCWRTGWEGEGNLSRMPGAGLEPAWGCPRGIFLPLQLSLLRVVASMIAAPARICGLDFTFTLPLGHVARAV